MHPKPPASAARHLIDFWIADQRGREHAAADYRGAVVMLVASDWAGSRYVAAWLKAMWDALAGVPGLDRLHALGVAEARGLPRLLRPALVAVLPNHERMTVLLDWEGVFATAYAFAPGECNVLVVDGTGRVTYRMSARGVDQAEVARLAAQIGNALTGATAAAEGSDAPLHDGCAAGGGDAARLSSSSY
jgi:hypothetical protein